MTRVDIGHVEMSMDEVRKPSDAIEEVTEAEMEEQGDRVVLEH